MAMPQPPDIYAITQVQGYCRTADLAPTVANLAALQPRLASRFSSTPQGWVEQQQQPEQLDVAGRIREVALSEAASADEGLAAYVSQVRVLDVHWPQHHWSLHASRCDLISTMRCFDCLLV
jgi:hypothetical protein